MNGIELRYEIFKALENAILLGPTPGEPLKLRVETTDPYGESKMFIVSIIEE